MTQPSAKQYDLNDLQSDVVHLNHMMETVYWVLHDDLPFVVPDDAKPGDRLPAMDRFSSLLWIARDLAGNLDDRISEHFREIGLTCRPLEGGSK